MERTHIPRRPYFMQNEIQRSILSYVKANLQPAKGNQDDINLTLIFIS